MHHNKRGLFYLAFAGMAFFWSAPASSIPLLSNGDFETGDFTGWTVTDLAGGSGSWFVDTPGNTTPLSTLPTSAIGGAPHGDFYAVSDQTGPGTHALTQAFTVAPGSSVILTFDMFVNDESGAGPIIAQAGLDHTGDANQHARVDILSDTALAFDTGAGVLDNLFLGVDLAPNPNDFTAYTFDITSIVGSGGTFQLRFAETDNQLFLNMGIDNVSIEAIPDEQVPEPGALALLVAGLAGMGFVRRSRKRQA